MQTIVLDELQIQNLIMNKSLCLDENKVLEIYDNELFLNKNGYKNTVISMNLKYDERQIENKNVINYIRNLICNHLNLEPCEVIFYSRYQDEFQFKVKTGNVLSKVIVYERRVIDRVDNTYDPVTKTIGQYKKLCESAYFFRWL